MTHLLNVNLRNSDFSIFFQPGIYQILNKKNGKIYYGESQNIAGRLSQHFYQLESNIHWTVSLQKDWNSFEATDFFWKILEIGPEWADSKKRLHKEKQLIKMSSHNCYNKLSAPFLTNHIPVSANKVFVNEQYLPSLKEAAKKYNISIQKAAALIKKVDSNWRYDDREAALYKRKKYADVSKKVKVNDIIFESISATGRYFDVHPKTVKKRIESGNFSNWLWADKDTIKKVMQTQSNRFISSYKGKKRAVQIDGQLFSSIADVAKFYNLHCATVRIRCLSNSKQFENWIFMERS